MLFYSLPQKKGERLPLRHIPAITKLRKAIGLAVEKGTRLHISLGKGSLTEPVAAASLVGLSTLERIATISSVSDRPPLATSGDGGLAILSQDTLKAAYRISNALELYEPDRGRLTGPTPFSYIAGALPTTDTENVTAHVLVGNFGPEVGLLSEAAEQDGAFVLAASDSLSAQAVLYASAAEPLIGEEVYAVPAYLEAGPIHYASLRTQDILRWGVIGFLIIGSVLKLAGIL